jgi:uncharacterized membrane protein YwzB
MIPLTIQQFIRRNLVVFQNLLALMWLSLVLAFMLASFVLELKGGLQQKANR